MKKYIESKIDARIRLDARECRFLFNQDLDWLARLADKVRARLHPTRDVTFVIDANINITNICTSFCDFCAFYCDENSPAGFTLPREKVLELVARLVEAGGTQVMLQGGINPALDLAYYTDLLRAIKKNFPVSIHSFSPPEVFALALSEKLSIREVLTELKNAGLDSLPGGGAEILVDRVRRVISPKKITSDEWFSVMRGAHAIGLRSTATMMFGHVEEIEERIEHLEKVRAFQDETGMFRAFIPWTFSPQGTKLAHCIKVGGGEYLKMLAISRLFLDNIQTITTGWLTEGMKVAELGLLSGANDFGGVLREEKVLENTGLSYKTNREEICEVIRAAGFTPVRRDTEYNTLEVY